MTIRYDTPLPKNPRIMYLYLLSIIQPARLQDIIEGRDHHLDPSHKRILSESKIREVHNEVKKLKLIYEVRRGSYCVTEEVFRFLDDIGVIYRAMNHRFFVMKNKRRMLERYARRRWD